MVRVFDRLDSDSTESDDERVSADGGTSVEGEVTPNRFGGFSWKMALTAGVMALVIGGFAAWATATMGFATMEFVIAAAGSAYFLYRKRIPSEAIGDGLYVTALLMLLTPILFYLPEVLADRSGMGTAEEAGALVGSVLGLFMWGFAFFVFAIVTAVIGYFFKRRARKKLEG